MLVDDHPGFRRVLRHLVECSGGECWECEDGEHAIREYPLVRPDLVLMDIAMKGVDGLHATARIISAFPEAHVLMLTQYDDPDLRVAARESGAEAYLLKDDLSQLKKVLACRGPEAWKVTS